MSVIQWLALTLSLCFSASGISHASSCENRSGISRTELLELYTSPAYTVRQYANAKTSGSGFVFTPQVIIAGRNYSAWNSNNSVQKDVRAALTTAPDASFVLCQQPVASGKLEFEVQAQLRQGVSPGEVRIYAALFQNGLVSDVGRGKTAAGNCIMIML